MPVAPFTSFQPYDYAVSFGIQAGFDQPPAAETILIVRSASFIPTNPELNSAGTTGQRGLLRSQRARGGRLVQVSMVVDILNNQGFRDLLTWAMGRDDSTDNPLPFGTFRMNHTATTGMSITNVICTHARISFPQGEVARMAVEGMAIADWDTETPAVTAAPAEGKPLLIDDLALTWAGEDMPVETVDVILSQAVVPVFANNAFPVSFQLSLDRAVTLMIEFPPAAVTYALLEKLREVEDVGEQALAISVKNGLMTLDAPFCKVTEFDYPAFDPDGISNIVAVFTAAGDESQSRPTEITVEIGA